MTIDGTLELISKSNKEQQDKWNQKNIDASLTAKARIEWIQSVRNATAELISLYTTLLVTYEKDELIRLIGESRKKSELLILFFGPEKRCNASGSKTSSEILLKEEDNDYKNDVIVQFLRDQQMEFNQHFKDLHDRKEERIKKDIEFWSKQRYINAEKGADIIQYDHEGNEYCINEPIINEDDEARYQMALLAQKNECKKIEKLENDLRLLCNFMRIYLKIEWNKAKNVE